MTGYLRGGFPYVAHRGFQDVFQGDDAQRLLIVSIAHDAHLAAALLQESQYAVLGEIDGDLDRRPGGPLEHGVGLLAQEEQPRVLHADDADHGVEAGAAEREPRVHVPAQHGEVLLEGARSEM